METGTKFYVGLCAAIAVVLVLAFRGIIVNWQQRAQYETQQIDITPEYVGTYKDVVHNRYYGTYDGQDASMDYVCGFLLNEYSEVIHAEFNPSRFSDGDSVWVVQGKAFKMKPDEDQVRDYLLSKTRTNTMNILYGIGVLVLVGLILWGCAVIMLRR